MNYNLLVLIKYLFFVYLQRASVGFVVKVFAKSGRVNLVVILLSLYNHLYITRMSILAIFVTNGKKHK